MLYLTLCMLLPWCFVKFLPKNNRFSHSLHEFCWVFVGVYQNNFDLNSNQKILMETLFQLFLTHLQFGPRTFFWFRHGCVLVFRKMSFLIHFDFSLLAGMIFRPLFTTFCYMFSFHLFSYQAHGISLHVLWISFGEKTILTSTAISCSSLF